MAGIWLQRFPAWAVVLRDPQGAIAGFFSWIELTGLSPDDLDLDPALRAAGEYLHRYAPLRSGELATLFRFWMAAGAYQDVSPVQSILFVNIVRYYLTTPGLAFTFLPCADPGFWLPGLAYGDIHRLPSGRFQSGRAHLRYVWP